MTVTPQVRIVGCGRWSMGDDAAGLKAAEILADMSLPDTQVLVEESPLSAITEAGDVGAKLLVVVDAGAADARHPVGSYARVDFHSGPSLHTGGAHVDTHTLGVASALEVADMIGTLPEYVWVYLIFGDRFERSLEVGGRVAEGVPALVDRIERDVREWLAAGHA